MKIKTTRVCVRKGCNKEFRMYRTTDKHCSPACAYEDQKDKPKPKRTPIKPFSEKRKRDNLIYTKKRNTFLAKPENKYCPIVKAGHEGLIELNKIFNNLKFIPEYSYTTEVHHKAGRRGKLLNYVPYWLAVSSVGHKWIHNNPKKAYKLDFRIRSSTVNI